MEALPLAIVLAVLVMTIAALEPRFLGLANVSNLLRNALILATIASGQMLVMMTGGLDLSVGAVAALSSVVSALVMVVLRPFLPEADVIVAFAGVAAGLLSGLLLGGVNGFCVAWFQAPALIVTLGMLSVATGLSFYLTSGAPIYGLPRVFTDDFALGRVFGLSNIVWCCIVVLVAVWVLQRHLPAGRHIRAVGGNLRTAHLSGLNTKGTLLFTYALSGVISALVGVLLTTRLGSGQSTAGVDLMLPSIAVAVIGGVSLRGGLGRIETVVLGGFFLAVVANGMNLLRLDSRYQTIAIGAIIILVTLLDRFVRARRG